MDGTGDTSFAERHVEGACRRLVGLMSAATASHVAPYLLWILPLALSAIVDFEPVRIYAAKSFLCALLIVWLKPWRYYAPAHSNCQTVKPSNRQTAGKARGLAIGLAAGLAVTFLWIFPESPWLFARAPGFTEFYNRWLIMPLGGFPDYFDPDVFPVLPGRHPSLAYAPWVCGWTLTIAKLLGSAFVISAAEEWFFRGFLYRWLRKGDFLSIDPARYDAQSFWLVVLVFGLEHDRWLAGMMAGAVYGWVVLRTGRIGPAIVAHATTNLALGIYIILSRQYGFW
jgi:membrane protease YdiL (CAAX protease family)